MKFRCKVERIVDSRGMAPSLAALLLDKCDCANNGGDLSGLKLLCSALESGFADGLKELRCALCPPVPPLPAPEPCMDFVYVLAFASAAFNA